LNVVSRDGPQDLGAFDLWNDPAWLRFGHVRSVALGGETFSGRLEQGSIDALSVCRIAAAGHRVEHVAEALAPGTEPFYKVLVQLHGHCSFKPEDGGAIELAPGDLLIYATTEGYVLTNPQAVEQIVVSLPAAQLPMAGVPAAKFLRCRISAQTGGGRLAVSLLRSTLDELPHCSPQVVGHMAGTICHLLAEAVREQLGSQAATSLKLVLRARVRDYVESNLADPELSADRIAARLNCSKRYLYQVFNGTGSSLVRYIWKRRLERCKDELLNVDRADRSLTDIAFSWGFSSLAHFSKAFKQEFGATPSAFRAK
jgi:AraC-like DNA-binding protein